MTTKPRIATRLSQAIGASEPTVASPDLKDLTTSFGILKGRLRTLVAALTDHHDSMIQINQSRNRVARAIGDLSEKSPIYMYAGAPSASGSDGGDVPMANAEAEGRFVGGSEDAGGAVLVGHSQSGLYPFHAALINPEHVKAVINIEAGGTCHENFGVSEDGDTTEQQLETLASMPVLMMYGDYLDRLGGTWQDAFEDCQQLVQEINDAGGNATMMHLPELGITGNSHMMMQARNNLEIADLIEQWIEQNVE